MKTLDADEQYYNERIAIAYDQRKTTLDLVALSAQIKSVIREPGAADAMIRHIFDIFEPGRLETSRKRSDQEDQELIAITKRSFKIELGKDAPLLMADKKPTPKT